MSQFLAVGSQINIICQTKFLTFTPDQFMKALREKNFIKVQSQLSDPANPAAPPLSVPMFSKDNVNVIYLQNRRRIVFQILNTVNLKEIYAELKKIMLLLNIVSDAIRHISFVCNTRPKARTEPQKNLTSLVKPDLLKGIKKSLGTELAVSSIRLGSSFPLEREGLQVTLEPLGTSPKDQYFLNIAFRTSDMGEFDRFIGSFGESMIREIVKEVEQDV